MKAFVEFSVLVRNTDTNDLRRIIMHGQTASEIRERAEKTIGESDQIAEIRQVG